MVVGSTLRLCLLDCTFGNLKERRVVPFESCFLCGLCILSIRFCGTLLRWYLGPLCVRASSIALLNNLKECRVARFEGGFFVAGTVRADVFSRTGPSFLKGLVFVLVDLVDLVCWWSQLGYRSQFLAFFVFWLASSPTLLGCCGSVINPT